MNTTLDNIAGYSGSIDDLEVHLYQGTYLVTGVEMEKSKEKLDLPFITIEKMAHSIQWRVLFQGSVVGEVDLQKPVVHFAGAAKERNRQTGEEVDWTKPLKKILPVKINRFNISDGTVVYHDFSSTPVVDISLKQIKLSATNISNVEDVNKLLPSSLKASAVSIGGGKLTVESRFNPLKRVPDVDLNLKFEEVSLPALNNFLEAYLNVDAESGTFFLYSEIVVRDGSLSGYIKPILTHVSLVNLGDGTNNTLDNIWEMVVGTLAEFFENQPEDQLATKVLLEGDLNAPDTAFFTSIWNVFRNAFIEAFTKNTDGTIKFKKEKS